MNEQKALVVTPDSLDVLNEHLRAGWAVTLAAPMGGGGQATGFASLVVIEQRAATADAILDRIEESIDAPEPAQDPLLRRLQSETGLLDGGDLGPTEN